MKEKLAKWLGIGAAVLVVVAGILTIIHLVLSKENTEVAYTYEAVSENLPQYDADLFNIDGKLDEDIYNELRWWTESYSEGDMQEPVNVRSTAYLGEKGVYFIFDVDDDNVNVDMKRASYNNSSITVYAAEEGTHNLEDNVWEIDILPTDYINAKRYLGGYYYGTVKAKGYENQPFVRTTTKGGDVNTPECKGYIMESYFPYGFLFEDGEKPENLNLNFALQRSYSLESDARDVYYNFGQHIMSNWSWGDPGTWWTFHEKGLDSVDLIFDAGDGGKLEHRNNYIARYQTEKIVIQPEDGYRISNLILETEGSASDVTSQIVWEDGVNYIKLRNVTDDVRLKATFEKIPTTKMTLTGRVSGSGKAEDLGVRFISGGITYTAEVAANGAYSLEVPTGNGTLEVYSKAYGYVAKKVDVTADSGSIKKDINLTASDYGNKRVMSLASEQVMGNKERLFNGEKMLGSMSKTFAYDFTLKYNGQLLQEDGTPVADPTFGEYDNQYTSINFKGSFTDAEGKAIEKSDMQLQIMSWNGDGMWMVKMWLDSQYVEARLGIDELKAFGGEEGVDFRLIFADSKLSLCIVRGSNVYKLTEIKATATADRYLKNIDFYAEHCINHSIWYVENQKLALGKTEADSNIVANVANGDGVVSFKKSTNGKIVRTASNWDANKFNGAFGWTGTIRVPGVLKNGKTQYHEMKTGYWVDTSKDDKDWYQFTVYIIGDGDSYYVTKNNQKTKLELNETQIKLLGTTGLQVGAFVNGNAISYFVDNGKGEMVVFADLYDFNENQAWYPWPNKYGGAYLIHEGAKSIGEVISTGAEFYTGLSKDMDVKGFVKNVIGDKYQSNQALNPVAHTFDSEENNYFVMNHKDVAENAFYGYNIQLDEWKNTSIYFNTKAWSEEYYASFVKLRVTEDSAYFIWQQGVSPYLCSEAIYFLNETQIAKLLGEGLDIYIEYKEHSPEMNLYVGDGKGNLVLASTFKDSLFRKSTGISYVKNLIGYSVEVENSETDVTVAATGCVVSESGDFTSDVKALYNKNIVKAEQPAKLIKIDSRELMASDKKINLDYYDFNIGGNWFDRFNVKLPDTVDESGKILTTATVKMTARTQGDEYYGQNMYLHLKKDSIGYLEFINYGGNWESYYYRLTAKQLAQLASKDGLNLFIGHKDNENLVTPYIADGSELVPLKVFTYGETELWAKGYSASYEGEEKADIDITVDCYKYEGSLEAALQQAYKTDYTISDEEVIISRSVDSVADASEKVNLDYGNVTVGGTWLDHFNVKLNGAVDENGEILKYVTAKMMGRLQGNQYFGQSANIRLTESGAYLEMPNYGIEDGNWSTYVYPLTAQQLKQLASADGMDIYIACAGENKITVYLADGTNLIAVKEFTYGSKALKAKGYSASYDGNKEDSVHILAECVPYDGTVEDALKNLYNSNYTISEANGVYSYDYVVKSEKYSKTFTTEDMVKMEEYSMRTGDYFYRINIHNEGVKTDGTVLEDSKITINSQAGNKNGGYIAQSYIYYEIKKGGASTIGFQIGVSPWTSETVELKPDQLKALGSEEGLNVYIAHSSEKADSFVFYLEDGNTIREMFTAQYSNAVGSILHRATCNSIVSDVHVKFDAYNYGNTDFATVIDTIYGEDYSVLKKVAISKNADGAKISGIKDIYHVSDIVSFKVQPNEGYILESVTLNNTPLTADKDGNYQFTLTEDHVNNCNLKVTTSIIAKTLRSFISLTGNNTTQDFSTKVFEEQTIGTLMDNGIYKYLFHTKIQADSYKNAYVMYTGWGSNGGEESYYAQFENKNNEWYLTMKRNKGNTWDFEKSLKLSEKQLEKISGNGLNLFLVYSGSNTFSLYVENDNGTDVTKVADYVSTLNNKKIYQLKHNNAGFTTNGFFYEGYTPTEAMKKFISYTKFVSLTGNSATQDFSAGSFEEQTIGTLMDNGVYKYLFHTKIQADSYKNAYVMYTGWGSNGGEESYYAQFENKNNEWYLTMKRNKGNTWDFEKSLKLSEKQLEKISGNGLNLFLVYSGSNTFSLYVENDNGTDVTKVADYVSTLNNKKIYQLKHNNTGFTTNGYFLKNYTTAQDAAKNLFDILN